MPYITNGALREMQQFVGGRLALNAGPCQTYVLAHVDAQNRGVVLYPGAGVDIATALGYTGMNHYVFVDRANPRDGNSYYQACRLDVTHMVNALTAVGASHIEREGPLAVTKDGQVLCQGRCLVTRFTFQIALTAGGTQEARLDYVHADYEDVVAHPILEAVGCATCDVAFTKYSFMYQSPAMERLILHKVRVGGLYITDEGLDEFAGAGTMPVPFSRQLGFTNVSAQVYGPNVYVDGITGIQQPAAGGGPARKISVFQKDGALTRPDMVLVYQIKDKVIRNNPG